MRYEIRQFVNSPIRQFHLSVHLLSPPSPFSSTSTYFLHLLSPPIPFSSTSTYFLHLLSPPIPFSSTGHELWYNIYNNEHLHPMSPQIGAAPRRWPYGRSFTPRGSAMIHRHIHAVGYTATAIDDVIGRGSRADWAALRKAADSDRAILEKILRVCTAKVADPYAQRYHLWKYHAEHALA